MISSGISTKEKEIFYKKKGDYQKGKKVIEDSFLEDQKKMSQVLDEIIEDAFLLFDANDKGFVTDKDIIEAMSKIGYRTSQEESEILIKRGNPEKGKLSFNDFHRLIRSIVEENGGLINFFKND